MQYARMRALRALCVKASDLNTRKTKLPPQVHISSHNGISGKNTGRSADAGRAGCIQDRGCSAQIIAYKLLQKLIAVDPAISARAF